MNDETNTQMLALKTLETVCVGQPRDVIVYYILSYLVGCVTSHLPEGL